jgi:hypothetical protein
VSFVPMRPSGAGPQIDARDNEGVQYGLGALLAGKITAEEFVTLNEVVGGTDHDSVVQAARSKADTAALNTAYRAGIVASGANLAKTAIIDLRGWDDSQVDQPPGVNPAGIYGIHHVWYSFATRDRIVRDYGDAGNQAMWRYARSGMLPPAALSVAAFTGMDKWLTTLAADTSADPVEVKVRKARPAETRDFCLDPNDTAQSTRIYDAAMCDQDKYLKPTQSPRQVAGGPRSEDILKCQLKPLASADYPAATFTLTQWTRLVKVFPDGVCDWSKPGVGQQAAVSPLTFKAGPGGAALGAAPASVGDK